MKIAYFDCFSGASGDMILAACIDAGLELEQLRRKLSLLGVEGYRIDAQPIKKQGFAATQLEVVLDPNAPRPHRHLRHILEILDHSRLPETVCRQAVAIFTRLAEAEAAVHGTTPEKVHFHEVGAIDAIVDVVGACAALEQLGIERVYVSPIPPGSGTITCEHGQMPVPAPATVRLLEGVPLAACEEVGELITPTGAAILTTVAAGYGPIPAMTIERVGVGAGRRDGRGRPNILRLIVGQAAEASDAEEADQILVLQANLDDVTGQVLGHVCEKLLAAGALDVFNTPIYMKKNRPATELTVLAEPAARSAIEDILFAETTTFGLRVWPVQRSKLSRSIEAVRTEVGEIRVKVGRRGERVVRVSPEYEDCRQAADRSGRPLIDVMELVRQAWHRQADSSR
ncbi:MAG TPA: nickel pincer cofactor biosynthesis protein LarC [Phycisphaerae bacterium]|nr:nickel pincer cofactor biosynthesis protein LarC [Phycisphaerae bacterium]